MTELSKDQKRAIYLEEEYRDEVRRGFEKRAAKEKKSGTKEKLWEFLNSSLGLLLIGSVVLAALGEGWRKTVAWRQEREHTEKVFAEIVHRATRAQEEIPGLLRDGGPSDGIAKKVLSLLRIDHLDSPESDLNSKVGLIYAFPEFKSWSIQNLLFQVQLEGSSRDLEAAKPVGERFAKIAMELRGPSGITTNVVPDLRWVIDQCEQRKLGTHSKQRP